MLGAGSWELTRVEGLREVGWTLEAVLTQGQQMFMKHLLYTRLDKRLRIQVSKVRSTLKKLFVEGRVARDLTISTSVGRVHRGEGRCPDQGWRAAADRTPGLSGGYRCVLVEKAEERGLGDENPSPSLRGGEQLV